MSDIHLPLTDELFLKLQKGDKFCKHIKNQPLSGKLQPNNPYYLDNDDILRQYVTDNKQRFEVVVLPESLILPALKMTHDDMGHKGSARTYMTLRRQYYWKGLKNCVYKHVKQCHTCLQHNKQAVKYTKLHFTSPPSPMKFISMDLICEFHPPSSKANKYALTLICMHTGYTFCIPLKTKKAWEVLKDYIDHVYSQFGGSVKILSDNGTEFKNKLFEDVAKQLGVEHKIYTPLYTPQSNGRIEGFHYFLKACISKHISLIPEWDDVVPLACVAYNFFPNEHSKQSLFFLMFGRDHNVPLANLLQPKIRYFGTDENILSLESLKNIYELVATNLKYAWEKRDPSHIEYTKDIKPQDLVLIKDHTSGPFAPIYIGDYRVVTLKGNQVEVMPCYNRYHSYGPY